MRGNKSEGKNSGSDDLRVRGNMSGLLVTGVWFAWEHV
jgi:hypothetical protein